MTREELKKFVYAAEHSSSLRRKLNTCYSNQKIIDLANSYGFSFSLKDLKEDESSENVTKWFAISEIAPFKKRQKD